MKSETGHDHLTLLTNQNYSLSLLSYILLSGHTLGKTSHFRKCINNAVLLILNSKQKKKRRTGCMVIFVSVSFFWIVSFDVPRRQYIVSKHFHSKLVVCINDAHVLKRHFLYHQPFSVKLTCFRLTFLYN